MDPHQRFHEWLAAGAEGEPPRDLAIHASVCAGCQESIAALDRLAMVDSGRATMPGGAAALRSTRAARVPPSKAPLAPLVAVATVIAPILAAAPPVEAAVPTQRGPLLFKRVPAKVRTPRAASIANPPGNSPPPPGAAAGDEDGPRRTGQVAALVLAAVLGAVFLGFGITQLLALHPGIGSGPTPTPGQGELQTAQPSASILQPSASPTATPVPTPVPTATPTPIPTPQPTDPPPPGAPSSPRNLTAVVSVGHIALSWSAPTSNGGSNVFRYDLYRDGSGIPFWTGNAFSHTDIVGNGATHVYRVTAVNAAGSSAYSNAATGSTPNVPSVVGNPQAVGGVRQVTLTWLAPAINGRPIIRYDVYRNNSPTPTYSTTSLSLTDSTGLTDGTFYTYAIRAVNAIGSSAPGIATATTAGLPGPPTNLIATGGSGQIVLSWGPPLSDGGSAITGYQIFIDGSLSPIAWPGSPYTHSGLVPGSHHTYQVKAVNAIGPGAAAATAGDVQAVVPGAPTNLIATGGSGQIVLSWGPPLSDGGSAITGYQIFIDGSLSPIAWPGSPYTHSGLVPGSHHTYQVKAVNAIGPGAAAATAGDVQAVVPGAPTNLIATGGSGQIVLSWGPPLSDGGSAITGYQIFIDGSLSPIARPGSPYTHSGLAPGSHHTYQVKAVNAIGPGAAAATAGDVQAVVPGAPRSVTATGQFRQIVVSWQPPLSDGGSAITGYQIFIDGSRTPIATGGSPYTHSGLSDNEPHSYVVKAVNSIGPGASNSPPASATTATVPGAPGWVSLQPGTNAGEVDLVWSTPNANRDRIFSYQIWWSLVSGSGYSTLDTGTTATSKTISGLLPGVTYYFVVLAENSVGLGPQSSEGSSASAP